MFHDFAAVRDRISRCQDCAATERYTDDACLLRCYERAIAIGAISIRRIEVRPFTDKQITLLETFADQAVIAIENVRLFQELKESLEQQTATSEILGVIASSPTDIQPVLDSSPKMLRGLCERLTLRFDSYDGNVYRLRGLIWVPFQCPLI